MELDGVQGAAETGSDAGRQVDAGKIKQTLLRMLLVFVVSQRVETANSLQK